VGQTAGSTEAGDSYGAAVAFADGNLVIGIPGEDFARTLDVGAAWVLPTFYDPDCEELLGADDEPADDWCPANLDDAEATALVQGRHDIPGRPVAGNQFGMTIGPLSGMDGFMVGASGRTVSGHRAAGSVVVMTPAPGRATRTAPKQRRRSGDGRGCRQIRHAAQLVALRAVAAQGAPRHIQPFSPSRFALSVLIGRPDPGLP
jgi:hypothetical protein